MCDAFLTGWHSRIRMWLTVSLVGLRRFLPCGKIGCLLFLFLDQPGFLQNTICQYHSLITLGIAKALHEMLGCSEASFRIASYLNDGPKVS